MSLTSIRIYPYLTGFNLLETIIPLPHHVVLRLVSTFDTQNWWLSQDCMTADDRVDQPSEEQEDSVHHRPQQGGPPLRVEVKQAQGHQGAH